MIKGLILALQFLTRLPINIAVDFNHENIKKSMFFFPYVGMLIGLIAYGSFRIFGKLGPSIGGFMTLLVILIITGGLHLDGVSDTCDGFFSNKPRDEILEIMKDSRIGAFGVIGLIMVILGKYVLLSNMGENSFRVLVFGLGNSRLIQAYLAIFKKNARPGGMGAIFQESKPEKYYLAGSLIYIGLVVLVDIRHIIPLACNFILGQLIASYSYKKIGGLTGDVYGLGAELGELVGYIGYIGVGKWI